MQEFGLTAVFAKEKGLELPLSWLWGSVFALCLLWDLQSGKQNVLVLSWFVEGIFFFWWINWFDACDFVLILDKQERPKGVEVCVPKAVVYSLLFYSWTIKWIFIKASSCWISTSYQVTEVIFTNVCFRLRVKVKKSWDQYWEIQALLGSLYKPKLLMKYYLFENKILFVWGLSGNV
jgi:hypothetical protein